MSRCACTFIRPRARTWADTVSARSLGSLGRAVGRFSWIFRIALVVGAGALLVTGVLFDVVDTLGGSGTFAEVAYWNISLGLVMGLLAAVGALTFA